MPFCPKCGGELRPNAKFCHRCGTEVIAISHTVVPMTPRVQAPTVERVLGGIEGFRRGYYFGLFFTPYRIIVARTGTPTAGLLFGAAGGISTYRRAGKKFKELSNFPPQNILTMKNSFEIPYNYITQVKLTKGKIIILTGRERYKFIFNWRLGKEKFRHHADLLRHVLPNKAYVKGG